ncbi:22871_t:CDS:1, partial [Gigaspora margarita]
NTDESNTQNRFSEQSSNNQSRRKTSESNLYTKPQEHSNQKSSVLKVPSPRRRHQTRQDTKIDKAHVQKKKETSISN